MRARFAIALGLAACTIACAGPKQFQSGRPVEIEHRSLGNLYKQDGKPVEMFSMLDGLGQVEEARAQAQSAKNWLIAGSVLAGLGGGALGAGVVYGATGKSAGWAVAGAGAGIVALSLLFVRPVDSRLENAIDAYNRKVGSEPSAPAARVAPAAAPVCSERGQCGAMAGLGLTF